MKKQNLKKIYPNKFNKLRHNCRNKVLFYLINNLWYNILDCLIIDIWNNIFGSIEDNIKYISLLLSIININYYIYN